MIDFKLIKLILFFYGCLQIKIIALKYILMTSIIYKWLQNFKKDFNYLCLTLNLHVWFYLHIDDFKFI